MSDYYVMSKARYAELFKRYMENAQAVVGKPLGDLTTKEIRELADAISEQIRREFRLTQSHHEELKAMVLTAWLGPDKGRKGVTR